MVVVVLWLGSSGTSVTSEGLVAGFGVRQPSQRELSKTGAQAVCPWWAAPRVWWTLPGYIWAEPHGCLNAWDCCSKQRSRTRSRSSAQRLSTGKESSSSRVLKVHRPLEILTAASAGPPWRSHQQQQQQQQWRQEQPKGPWHRGWGAPGISGWAAPVYGGSVLGFMVAWRHGPALDQGSAQSYFTPFHSLLPLHFIRRLF